MSPEGAEAVEAAVAALSRLPALLPELAELTPCIRVTADERVATAGIFPSGRMLVNPRWFAALTPGDALFVVAHELMHLLLRTHDRAGGLAPLAINVAHDYVINDMLAESLGRAVPAGGLAMENARHLSLEELAPRIEVELRQLTGSFRDAGPPRLGTLGAALGKAGLAPAPAPRAGEAFDVLDGALERTFYPGEPLDGIDLATTRVREAALRAVSLGELRRGIDAAFHGRGTEPGGAELLVEALRTAYRPPWEEALSSWMEAVAPGDRTYVRPPRRGADRRDVVLPGRRREGWTLHLVLDTSGSMVNDFPRILGAIAACCEAHRVETVHVLQCDTEVTRDELVAVEKLQTFAFAGLGGSDLCPAMHRLALDPEVDAAIVVTDGYIGYPAEPMPYAVLWAVTAEGFAPPYGKVVCIDDDG